MKETLLEDRDPLQIEIVKKMVKVLAIDNAAMGTYRRRPNLARERVLSMQEAKRPQSEIDEFIASLQSESTRRTLSRPASQDAEWWNRPLPAETIAASKRLEEAKTDEERGILVGERKLDPQQVQILEAHRRNSKNTVGQSEVSATSPQQREAAIHAFYCSPPATLTPAEKAKIQELTPYSPLPPLPVEEEERHPSFIERHSRLLTTGILILLLLSTLWMAVKYA